MKSFALTIIIFALLPNSVFAQADARDKKPELASLKWLAGSWHGIEGNQVTEEQWMEPRGGLMPGMNRTVVPERKSAFEFMWIEETSRGLSFFASPGGKPASEFPMKESTENSVVFENPDHDFPQRIIYRLDGDILNARIEGLINGKPQSMEWKWTDAKSAETNPRPTDK